MGRQKKIPSVNDTIMSLAQDSENKNYWNTKKLTNIPHQPKLFVSHRDGYLLDIIFTPKLIQVCYIILSRLTYKYTYIRVKNINLFPFSLPFHTLLFLLLLFYFCQQILKSSQLRICYQFLYGGQEYNLLGCFSKMFISGLDRFMFYFYLSVLIAA